MVSEQPLLVYLHLLNGKETPIITYLPTDFAVGLVGGGWVKIESPAVGNLSGERIVSRLW